MAQLVASMSWVPEIPDIFLGDGVDAGPEPKDEE